MVDNVGFRDLVRALDPRYQIPSRPVFSESVIPSLYHEVKRNLKADLANTVGGISFTTDMWRSGQHTEYMCVTLHWIVFDEQNNEMKQRSALVSIEEFPEAATANNIRQRLEEVFSEWCGEVGRGKDCVIIFGVSDNGANVKKALLDAADEGKIFGWVSCFAHNLNLTVQHAVKTQRNVADGLTILRKVVSKVLNSTPIKRRFEELQRLHYPGRRQHLHLHPDVPTRWNSVLTMLESILPQRLAVEALIQDRVMQSHHDIVLPHVFNYWTDVCDAMEELVKILRPFHEATLICSQEKSTLSSYVPTSKGPSVSVTGAPAEGVGSTKDLLLNGLNKITADRILREGNCHVYFAATLLDPRYKKKFVPRERLDRVIASLVEAAVFMAKDDEIGQQNEEGDLSDTQQYPRDDFQPDDPVGDFSDDEAHEVHDDDVAVESQASLMASIVAAATDDDDDGTADRAQMLSVKERVNAELTSYINEPAMETTASTQAVLKYWQQSRQSFPILSRIAMSYLACPMSSVSSERMFSLAGNILTKKQCAMKSGNLNKLAVIKVNRHYLQ
ncbi:zinc finger BED domain-containing protein 4-like [Lytechinus pictus]|uniref:zinc finger BED domain-containing protein 4-like n=1 Tax=Lytechinus pictus TaxID=7653 RepID=UPI0030BA263A